MENVDYQTIEKEVVVEQEIQKSKFITYLSPVQTEDEAKDYLKQIKKMHPKATHHCSAYIVGEVERSNDDGEPASSAGMPMLQVLRGHNMQFVIAVVVRYYGGTLLGVGGLIRAYGSSVTHAIEASNILFPQLVYTYTLDFPYDTINDIEVFIAELGTIVDRRYDDEVSYDVQVTHEDAFASFYDVTHGKGNVQLIETTTELVRRR